MQKHRDERGFTLMELMVVIVIVAILAAVAVPLYINYVKDAQRTEAKGAIGAIITAEQAHYQRFGAYIAYTNTNFTTPPTDPALRLECDVSAAQQNWTFTVALDGGDPTNFVVTATGIAAPRPAAGLRVIYTLKPTGTTQQWDESAP